MQQWEYCYVSTAGHPQGEFRLCTANGEEALRVNGCSKAKAPWACVVACLGSQGWEAIGVDSSVRFLWFKRPKQG